MGISKSYEMIGRVLSKCIAGGLRGASIEPSDVGLDGGVGEDFRHFMDVMTWLKNEGMITVGMTSLSGEHYGVQLTSRGIAAIEVNSFGEGGQSVRETIERSARGDLGADVYAKIGSFMGGLFGGAAQSIG